MKRPTRGPSEAQKKLAKLLAGFSMPFGDRVPSSEEQRLMPLVKADREFGRSADVELVRKPPAADVPTVVEGQG